jgi:hypothetical protein
MKLSQPNFKKKNPSELGISKISTFLKM